MHFSLSPGFNSTGSKAEKSPLRSACVGTVLVSGSGIESLMPSQPKNQNTLFFPLKTFGIHNGPPAGRPPWLSRVTGLRDRALFVDNGVAASADTRVDS